MEKTCIHCGLPFKAEKSTRKFCSPRCYQLDLSARFKDPNSLTALIAVLCPKCGQTRNIQRRSLKYSKSDLCRHCSPSIRDNRYALKGPQHPSWKGGRKIRPDGYIELWIGADDFFFPMADKAGKNSISSGYIREHRLVMAKHLGRCLHPWEVVHHKDGNKKNNAIENLQLTMATPHTQLTKLEARIDRLLEENKELKKKLREYIATKTTE